MQKYGLFQVVALRCLHLRLLWQLVSAAEPVVKTDIPQSYAYNSASGTSIAEQGYKQFFADPRLLEVIDLALANNRDFTYSNAQY